VVRKPSDAFYQILVSIAVIGDLFAEPGDDLEGVGIIERLQLMPLKGRELEAKKPSAWLQHPTSFGKCAVDMGHIANAKRDGIGVHAGAFERQALGIGGNPIDAGKPVLIDRPIPAYGEHRRVDIRDRNRRRRPSPPLQAIKHAKRDIARATGNIDHANTGPGCQNVD